LFAVDRWREGQADRPSRAEAVRRLVETGLTLAGQHGVQISDGEKLILSMLTDLLAKQAVKSDLNPKLVMSALHGGHYWGLRMHYNGVFHGHRDSDEHVNDVINFLDMWFFIETGDDKLSPQDKERVKVEAEPFGENPRFRGFDGNNESDYLSIARFLIDDLKRFTHFAGRDLNSHMPVTAGYRVMCAIFERIRPTLVGRELNAAEIIELLNAWAP
jgi:uncharacterized protein YfbU (UPF0304 family)